MIEYQHFLSAFNAAAQIYGPTLAKRYIERSGSGTSATYTVRLPDGSR